MYVGNLAVGIVTQDVLRELFDVVMSQMLPDAAAAGPPVININMDASQKFGFVELRSEALATAAIHLDKTDVCGRPMNVGRPRGYVEPPPGYVPSAVPVQSLAGAALAHPTFPNMGVGSGGGPIASVSDGGVRLPAATPYPSAAVKGDAAGPTTFVCLENVLPPEALGELEAREDVELDVRAEAAACGGPVLRVLVPAPTPGAAGSEVFVSFETEEAAAAAQRAMHRRTFDGNVVSARFVERAAFDAAAARVSGTVA